MKLNVPIWIEVAACSLIVFASAYAIVVSTLTVEAAGLIDLVAVARR